MDFKTYISQFDEILTATDHKTPYNDPHFLEYAKLSYSRTKRWLKSDAINPELVALIKSIKNPQKWVLILEHWCADASNIAPFIYLFSELNPLITLEIQLRDSNSEISNYLTNGSKSIPIFIVRNANNEDLFHWGSRPAKCQEFFLEMKKTEDRLDELKKLIQIWYNDDKGVSLQEELLAVFNEHKHKF
jgi:hypothetical protein